MMHVPVAVITERLRAQSLEDDALKAQREGGLQIEGKNVWAASEGDNSSSSSRDQDGCTTSISTTTITTPSAVSIRERGMSTSTSLPFLPPLHDSDRMMMVAGGNMHRGSPTAGVFPATPRGFPPSKAAAARVRSSGGVGVVEYGPRCLAGAGVGDHYPRAFETPPKKKQCRSLSVPVDSPPHGMGLVTASAFVEGAKVWRPIPITALTSSPSPSLPCSAGCSGPQQADPRSGSGTAFMANSQDSRTFSSFTAVGSTTARFYRDFKVVGSGGGGGGGGVGVVVGGAGGGGGGGGRGSGFPLAPSPLSIDSGRDTTSEPHTPSQSPVPRPASASSLRSSHPYSSTSSVAWWSALSPKMIRGGEVFFPASRSVSYEEQISMGFQASGGASSGSSPCVVGGGGGGGVGGGGGGGVMGGGGGMYGGMMPLSPCRMKIPRCHSQPCVLHHRRYAKKRRRDDRPTLDFHKMTETAYQGRAAISVTPAQEIQRRRWGYELDGGTSIGGLMPIASSPRDSDLPSTTPLSRTSSDLHPARVPDLHPATRGVSDLHPAARDPDLNPSTAHAGDLTVSAPGVPDLDIAACAHLPSTPPPSDVSSGIDIREPVKLIGEEEEEEELEELEEEEDRNCDCHRESDRDDNHGLFPLTDLDLEQIENH